MSELKKRVIWIDNVKVIACILVVLGHFFQSMIKSGLMPENNLYEWFEQTIYYFHVPLFFICSGYLYQKRSVVRDSSSWKRNIVKKFIALGIPYFTFSFITWILKTYFTSSVNDPIGPLGDVLFLHPTSPYWFLYALFFIFIVTPTFSTRTMAVTGLFIALILKTLEILFNMEGVLQALIYILINEIWFVIGMFLNIFELDKDCLRENKSLPIVAGMAFVVLSILVYINSINYEIVGFGLGLLACYSVISLMVQIFNHNKQTKVLALLAKYTMPIFLMHTLFAASVRVLLLKLAINNVLIHISLGISISFLGPIIAAIIMNKSKWLEFII